jgi:putative endonuclease
LSWNKTTGNKGEELAVDYLSQTGHKIIERNWRFRYAEVDIIAAKNNRLHFFEIKTRVSTFFLLIQTMCPIYLFSLFVP